MLNIRSHHPPCLPFVDVIVLEIHLVVAAVAKLMIEYTWSFYDSSTCVELNYEI